MGEMETGLVRTRMVYIANNNAPHSIHQSPVEKRKVNNRSILPFDNKRTMPVMQMINPAHCSIVIFSLRKIAASKITNKGEEVVPINARLIAGE